MQTVDILNENFIQFDNFYFNDVGQCLTSTTSTAGLILTVTEKIDKNAFIYVRLIEEEYWNRLYYYKWL